MKARKLLWIACLALLGACRRDVGGDALEPGSSWDVFKGDRKVLWMKSAPGPILSTALLPPGAKPKQHQFVTATALDPMEESALGALLGNAKDFPEFVALLKANGYRVAPSSRR